MGALARALASEQSREDGRGRVHTGEQVDDGDASSGPPPG